MNRYELKLSGKNKEKMEKVWDRIFDILEEEEIKIDSFKKEKSIWK